MLLEHIVGFGQKWLVERPFRAWCRKYSLTQAVGLGWVRTPRWGFKAD
jgi:hypothetical protein